MHRRLAFAVGACSSLLGLSLFAARAQAVETDAARITRVVGEVKIQMPQSAPRAVSLNANVPDGALVRTGANAQAELTFADQTQVRLAEKTSFAFTQGTRQMELRSGALLVHAPSSARGAEVRADKATIALTGTTVLLEHNAGRYVKLVVLDGPARMFLKSRIGESVLVDEGQLLMFHLSPTLNSLPNPVDVDIKRLMATSKLVQGFRPLGSEGSIAQKIAAQKQKKKEGGLVDTNLVIFGRGTIVSLVNPATVGEQKPAAASPTPASSPHKKKRSTPAER